MLVNLEVQRFDPEHDGAPHVQTFTVDVPGGATVLEALMQIKDENDGSLSFRRSCRSAICGSCTMSMNGLDGLACKTPLRQLLSQFGESGVADAKPHETISAHAGQAHFGAEATSGAANAAATAAAVAVDPAHAEPKHDAAGTPASGAKPVGTVRVSPMHNLPIVKDLVVDMTRFWEKNKSLKPWLVPKEAPPEREYRQSPVEMERLWKPANCIFCGTCYSLCPVVSVDDTFVGPAAIARVGYRFLEDTRDGARKERAENIVKQNLWLCAHCYACSYCPKHVDPHELIALSCVATIEEGVTDNTGARHAMVVADTIKKTGFLEESQVIPGTLGYFNLVKLAPVIPLGLRLLLKGKMPPLLMRPVPRVTEIREIFKAAEARRY
jgi:succinate dehydrogenase / fumarate reductase iron-sulfur subunit